MKKLGLIAAILALPALAQAPQFHVALSGQFGSFSGFSEGLAVESYSYNGSTYTYGGSSAGYDLKSKTPLQLDLGVTSGDDDFSLSYWTGKAKANGSFTAPTPSTGYIYFYSPYSDYLNSVGYDQGNGEVKAHTLDLSWTRTFAKSDKGSLAFSLGIREFKIEHHMFLDQWDTGSPKRHMGYDQIDASTKGVGLSVGLSGRYNFTDRVWFSGGVKIAQASGNSDFNYHNGYDPAYYSGYNPYLVVQSNGQKTTSLQVDSELKLNVNFVGGFDGFVGYRMKSFQSVLGDTQNSGAYGYNTISNFSPRDVSFNGVVVGLGLRF